MSAILASGRWVVATMRCGGAMVMVVVGMDGAVHRLCGDDGCQDYTMQECVWDGYCEISQGQLCGSPEPGCRGVIDCVLNEEECEESRVDMDCIFAPQD